MLILMTFLLFTDELGGYCWNVKVYDDCDVNQLLCLGIDHKVWIWSVVYQKLEHMRTLPLVDETGEVG